MRLRLNFKNIFFSFITLAGTVMILHIGYLELRGHCVKKNTLREIVALMAPTMCNNSACLDSVYESLDKQKKEDYCRYVNFGE